MVVLNEEKTVREALKSVKWMDEIIVVDALSTDKTVKICQEYQAKIFSIEWLAEPDQKNFAIQQASSDWVFLLDADERVRPQLTVELEELLNAHEPPRYSGFFIPRKNYYYGKWLQWGGCYPDYQLRFFKNRSGYYGTVEIHPRFIIDGEVSYFQHPMDHFTYPSIGKHFQKQNAYTTRAAREKGKTKKYVMTIDLLGRPLFTFLKYFFVRKGFKDGTHGLIASVFASLYTFGKYAKLFESRLLSRGKTDST